MNAAVVLFLDEMRMLREGVLVAVLKDEIAARVKEVVLENFVRNVLEAFQSIWRIGEDNVEFLAAERQKIENVRADHSDVRQAQTLGLGLDE